MQETEPLLDGPSGRIVFQRPGTAIQAGAFVAHANALAAALPQAQFIVNACRDRYLFAVTFAACLIAGRTALLNVGPAPGTGYPGCRVIGDQDAEHALPTPPAPATPPRPATPHPPSVDDTAIPMIPCGQLAAIVFTSGSTGVPVAHEKRWGALVQRSRAAAAAFDLNQGSIVGTVPPHHMYGFELTVLQPLHAPVSSWCGPAFFPGDVAEALLACPAPRWLVTTPLQLRALLQGELRLPLAGVISATAPLDAALAARAEEVWRAPVNEIFGATECGSIASRRTTAGPAWAAYPGIGLAMEDGGAVVDAPHAEPVRLSDVLEPAPGGFLLLGRRTDVVKLAGRRASLPGLNQLLISLPGIQDGAFIVPDDLDERSTARLVAVVVAPGRTAAAILADLRRVLDPVFLPRRVILVDRLPRNELGKLPRLALMQLVAGRGAA